MEFRKILLVSETHREPICLIGDLYGDPSETNMPDRRPIRDFDMLYWIPIRNRHTPSETDMPDRQPIGALMKDQHTFLIGDALLETDMPKWRRITGDRHA